VILLTRSSGTLCEKPHMIPNTVNSKFMEQHMSWHHFNSLCSRTPKTTPAAMPAQHGSQAEAGADVFSAASERASVSFTTRDRSSQTARGPHTIFPAQAVKHGELRLHAMEAGMDSERRRQREGHSSTRQDDQWTIDKTNCRFVNI
jgi:hypothetical protein